MYYNDVLCTPEFRQYLIETIPGVLEEQRFFNFVAYLLFAPSYDDNGNKFLPASYLAKLEGCSKDYRGHRYRSKTYLEAIQNYLLPEFRWGNHRYDPTSEQWIARTVLHHGLPDALIKRAREEYQQVVARCSDCVYLLSGRKATAKQQAIQWTILANEVQSRLEDTICEEQRKIMEYLNRRSRYQFTGLLDYVSIAEHIILDNTQNDSTPYRRDRLLSTLVHFFSQPQPLYAPSTKGYGTRLYGCGSGLLSLMSEARRAMTSAAGMVELDLRSAHLAINATIWGVPALADLLMCGNIWQRLAEEAGLVFSDRVKQAMKEPILAVTYGADQRWAQRLLGSNLGNSAAAARLFAHPALKALISQRDRMIESVIAAGGRENCFGVWIPVEKPSASKSSLVHEARRILALCSQAYELKLLYPVFELAQTVEPSRAWQITLFQHDGFTLSIRDRSRTDAVVRKLQEVVSKQANELGIPTALDVK